MAKGCASGAGDDVQARGGPSGPTNPNHGQPGLQSGPAANSVVAAGLHTVLTAPGDEDDQESERRELAA